MRICQAETCYCVGRKGFNAANAAVGGGRPYAHRTGKKTCASGALGRASSNDPIESLSTSGGVDHIDSDPSNNSLANLRWASKSEQTRHSYATNAARKSSAPKLSKPVRDRRMGEAELTTYPSVNEAARQLGLYQGNVSACCAGRQKQTGGFEFELANAEEPEQLEGEEWRDVAVA